MNDLENIEETEEPMVYPYWNLINPTAEKILYIIFFASVAILTIISFRL